MKTLLKQTSATAIWILVVLLVLELLMQGAALLVKEKSWRAQTQWLTGDVRVLALGDSNTYGLYLPPEEAYPAQLEKQWNSLHSDMPIEMINLGYPGTNSFRLLANLPDILDTFKPNLVLLMIGFNDFWTPVENLPDTQQLSWLEKIQYHSRVYKLFYMVFQNFYVAKNTQDTEVDTGARMLGGYSAIQLSDREKQFLAQEMGITVAQLDAAQKNPTVDTALKTKYEQAMQKILAEREKHPETQDILNTVKYGDKTFSLGIQRGESAHNSKQMEQNLSSMLIQLNERNIPYILVNYPSNHGYYPAANRKIAKVAEQTQSPYVDLSNTFSADCRKEPKVCPDYFFYDGHATAQGNTLISATVLKGLEDFFHTRQ